MSYAAPVMSTTRPMTRPWGPVSALRAPVVTTLAGLALVLGSSTSARALPSDTTPAPAPAPTTSCPPGQGPTLVTQPPTPGKTPKPNPSASALPDGSTVQSTCVVVPPTPFPAPVVAPDHTVGGAKLAAAGVIVDKPASVPDPPVVTDTSYVIADMDSGAVIAAKNPHAWLPPASTLKTLTSLVVLPALDPTSKVTATDSEVTADGTRVGMVSGATYSVTDLFHGLVLMSGNDTAYALADAYGGRDKTIAAMNATAARLGAWDTIAVDPSGLDADQQRSSAYDLALFGRAVMKLPAYRSYAVTKDYTFPGGTDRNGKTYAPFAIQNHNTLLDKYPGTIGIKNGYTTGARHTFIGAATRGGRTFLVTQMGGTVVPSWQPSAALLDWAVANANAVTPVGRLVDGAPKPPELGGTPAPTTAGTPSPSAAPEEPLPTGSTSNTVPALAAARSGDGAGGNPGPQLISSARDAARSPVTYVVLAVLVLAGLVLRRARVRRSR
jgi:D-alanyl-D-alanine carboxypeptidase (penicillin-binding protein 5/6)